MISRWCKINQVCRTVFHFRYLYSNVQTLFMRITLVISSLARAGAERVMCVLASSWAEQGKEVTLLTFDRGETPAYSIHPSVKRSPLNLNGPSTHVLHGFYLNLQKIWILRRVISNSHPDVVISFMDMTNVLTLLSTRGLGCPVIVCEHVDPALYTIGRFWGALRRLTYPFADRLVCLTQATLKRFETITKVKGCIIPDPVVVSPSGPLDPGNRMEDDQSRSGYILIAMGRLVPQKGFDILLNVFSKIATQHPKWSLKILGSGPLKDKLETQARSLDLVSRVHFVGEVLDPFALLRTADLFVLSSRFEGFGLALCEAMACGLPVVSFDCPSGPGDIVRHGVDGILVPPEDASALAESLDFLMTNAQERQRLASRAPEILRRFGTDKILGLWEDLFKELQVAHSADK